MPISVQTPPGSANNELIPVTGDTNWGPYTTSWMLAANNNLGFPKTGGLYYLTGDVNFGNTNGFILKYLISEAAATPSTSGVLRLGSADSIGWRNNANSANLLLGINGSDQLTFNGVPIASSATNGMLAQISPGVVVGRTITGTSLQIDLVNGDGIAGNPVVSIDPGYVGQTSITTLGTITTGTWNGTTLAIAYGGTSATTANTAFNNLAPTQTSNANKYLQTDGTNTSWQPAVRSVSLNDASSTPIYTTSPTGATTGIVAETITLNTQNANLMFAGPASGGAVQPSFRHLVNLDLAGTAPGSNTDVIYNSSGNFAANSGFTYDGVGTLVLGNYVIFNTNSGTVNLYSALTGAPTPINILAGPIQAAPGSGQSDGGALTIQAGSGVGVSGTAFSGNLNLNGGQAVNLAAVNNTGGNVNATGGNSLQNANGGAVNLLGGTSVFGIAGTVNIQGGTGGSAGSTGGSINITVGTGVSGNGTVNIAGNTAITGSLTTPATIITKNVATPLTGVTIHIANFTTPIFYQAINPAGTLAVLSVQAPPNPVNGQIIRVKTTQTLTSFGFTANGGQTVAYTPTTLAQGGSVELIWDSGTSTWY